MESLAKILFWTSIAVGAISFLFNPEETFLGQLLLSMFFIGLGFSILFAAFIYDKETHKKENYAINLLRTSSGLIDWILSWILGRILDKTPWWLLKMVYFLLGISFIAFGIFLLTLD